MIMKIIQSKSEPSQSEDMQPGIYSLFRFVTK